MLLADCVARREGLSIDLRLRGRWNQGGQGGCEQHYGDLPHREPDHASIPQHLSEVIINV